MPNAQPGNPGEPRPRSYRHVLERVYDHPWALSGGPTGSNPELLFRMSDIMQSRLAGEVISLEEIDERLAAARAEQGDRLGSAQVGAVRVLPMYGLITQRATLMSAFSGGASIDDLRDAFRGAMADPDTAAIVFDMDSPGGSVDGVPELAEELRRSRGTKPIIGVANTLTASAAYWLAAQFDEIVATPSAEVGSIGVYAMHQDVSRAYDAAGITPSLISAGKYKVEGNEFEPLSDEARSQIQHQVDAFYRMFVSDVAKGRGVSTTVVGEDYGQGRTMLAQEAKAAGLVDRIATLEETIQRLQPKRGRQVVTGTSATTWFVLDELTPAADASATAPVVTPIQPAAPAASKEERASFVARLQQRRKVRK